MSDSVFGSWQNDLRGPRSGWGRPPMEDLDAHRWWKLYVLTFDDEHVDPRSGAHREQHWYFNREDQKVTHKGKSRNVRSWLFAELSEMKSGYDPYTCNVVPNCGEEYCINPHHQMFLNRGEQLKLAAAEARKVRAEATDVPMRERRVDFGAGPVVAGDAADSAYLGLCTGDMTYLYKDGQVLFGQYHIWKDSADVAYLVKQMMAKAEDPADVMERCLSFRMPSQTTLEKMQENVRAFAEFRKGHGSEHGSGTVAAKKVVQKRAGKRV